MIGKSIPVTFASFLALGFNGLTLTFIGTSLPVVQEFIGVGLAEAGLLMAMLQGGFTIFSFIAGILSDTIPKERILAVGCTMIAVGSLLFGATSLYQFNLSISLCMGAGIGCVLSGSNSLLISLYPRRKGFILNIHHIFFGLGSLVGPLVMGYLIVNGNHWRAGFIGQGIFLLLLGLFYGTIYTVNFTSQGRSRISNHLSTLAGDRDFQIILICNSFAMGAQVTIMLLGVTYLIEAKDYSLVAGSTTLAAFSVFIMIGRLICSRLTLIFRHSSIILILLWLQLIALILVMFFQNWVVLVGLALSGLAFSGVYPTSLALSSIFFPRIAGSALGIISTIGGLGTVVLCWLTGLLADLTDMARGFSIVVVAACVALFVFQTNYFRLVKRESDLAKEQPKP